MAEAVVNAVVQQLVSIATGWLKEEISLLRGVKPKLENMKTKMESIQMVLEDAENQSVKKKIVKLWLEKLQDVAYDMDDVLDEWRTKVHILKREEGEENNTSDEYVPSSSSSPTTCLSLKKLNCFSSVKQLPWRREIANRIKDINERINLLFSDMEKFELASKTVGNDVLDRIINHDDIVRTTTSFVDESTVYGRDDDKDFLLSKVLAANTEHEESLQVISIVGAGGLGKTTLAQLVFNDEKVKEKFGEKRIWVCVSNPFDEFKVSRHILEGLKVDHTKMISLQNLYQSVGDSLSGHKFLLVLDDVWNENFEKWRSLGICLKLGDPASRLLVTTRKEEVATLMGTTPSNILKPRLISDLDCWFLMSQIAFLGRTNQDNDKFEDIGKEIAKKCKGLPLAAKTLGGMLMSKHFVDEWIEILNSEIWKLKKAEMELFPHIFLSYQELPPVLKRCFLILAIFPKDTELKGERVIAIWMAHGFLNQGTKEDEDDMVKTGENYLKFLVSRAFLEKGKWWYHPISMHDIMHDFALHISGDEVISTRVLDKIGNDSSSKPTSKGGSCLKLARQLYIDGDVDPSTIDFDVEKLRTCIIYNVAPNVASDLVKRLKMVRALYLVDCELEQVPQSIENLIHLRLLDLSDNPLVELPETIGDLNNLQQLLLERSDLSSLPNSIGKLTNLIFLKPDDLVLKMAPESAGKLINLHNYGGTIKVEAGKSKLGFLKDLNQLRELRIVFNSDYGDEVDAKKAIGRKKHIIELDLNFNSHEVTDGVIAALQPPSNIQVLKLRHLPPSCVLLPSWITSLNHLTKLKVDGARNVSTLPPLGELQSLKKLHILGFGALKIIGREFLGMGNEPNKKCSSFPMLVELKFIRCRQLTGWEDLKAEEEDSINVMPSLKILNFVYCQKFDKLPRRLLRHTRSLKQLWIDSVSHRDTFDETLPGRLLLNRGGHILKIVVEGSTKVPVSINYHNYITLLDIFCGEQPISCLPPMGKLPYLKSLTISGFTSLKLIGRDFLGIDDGNNDENFVAFPNLLQLSISNCCLQQWEDLKEEDEGKLTVMPKLWMLHFWCCEELQVLPSRLLRNAASLEELEISSCDLLQEWEDLNPEDEGKVTVMPKLQRLHITRCPKLEVLPSRLLCRAASLEELKIFDCDLLQEWEDLKPEDEDKVTVMPKLRFLQIKGCPKFQVLPSRLLRNAASLEELEISYCDLLQEWEDLKPEDKGKVTVMPKLQRLTITYCKKLQVLPSRLLCRAASLEELWCHHNDSLAENIKKDEQLLRHVKNVYVDDQQCSLHPSSRSQK